MDRCTASISWIGKPAIRTHSPVRFPLDSTPAERTTGVSPLFHRRSSLDLIKIRQLQTIGRWERRMIELRGIAEAPNSTLLRRRKIRPSLHLDCLFASPGICRAAALRRRSPIAPRDARSSRGLQRPPARFRPEPPAQTASRSRTSERCIGRRRSRPVSSA